MKNSIMDLHNHLFITLERLNDEDKTADEIKVEIERSKAIADVSEQIIDIAKTTLKAAELQSEYGALPIVVPEQFRLGGVK